MWRIAVLIIVALTIVLPAQAKQKKSKKHETSQETVKEQVVVEQRVAFGPAERNLIRAHLLSQERAKSQSGYKNLPPGLQKKIHCRKIMSQA